MGTPFHPYCHRKLSLFNFGVLLESRHIFILLECAIQRKDILPFKLQANYHIYNYYLKKYSIVAI